LIPVFNADAAHCQKGGTLFRVTAYDANGNVVVVLTYYTIATESSATWRVVANLLKEIYGENFGNAHTVVISDRDKGLICGFHEVLPEVHSIFCHNHLARDVKGKFGRIYGPIRAAAFARLAYATTEAEFKSLWDTNPALQVFLPPKETWAKVFFRARAFGKMATTVRLCLYVYTDFSTPICNICSPGRGGT
jgi:hypothetical protein